MEFDRYDLYQPLYGTVNVYRVGDTLVDTGHTAPASHEELRSVLSGREPIDRVVLTHPHPDHVGGSLTRPELAETPHVVFEGVPDILADYDGYLTRIHEELQEVGAALDDAEVDTVAEMYFGRGDYIGSIAVDRVVSDGDTVTVGPYDCQVVHTPGHNREHMALWHPDSGTILAGDLLSENGHFMFGPLSADIDAFRLSLRRIRDLDPDLLAPGHGPLITRPRERLEDALQKADRAYRQIREYVERADGPVNARTLARDVFGAEGAGAAFLTYVVSAYLESLAERNIVTLTQSTDGVFARAK